MFGRLDPDEALTLAAEHFAGWKPGDGKPVTARGPAELGPPGRPITFVPDVQARVAMVRLRCTVPAGPVGEVLAEAVGTWAWRDLRTERGLSYGGFATVVEPVLGRHFLELGAPVETGRTGEVVKSWLDRLEAADWTVAEVDGARAAAATARGNAMSSSEGWYGAIRDTLLAGGTPDDLTRWPELASALSHDEVLTASRACAERLAVTVEGNVAEEAALTGAGLAWTR